MALFNSLLSVEEKSGFARNAANIKAKQHSPAHATIIIMI
jgi:hypothetical protein